MYIVNSFLICRYVYKYKGSTQLKFCFSMKNLFIFISESCVFIMKISFAWKIIEVCCVHVYAYMYGHLCMCVYVCIYFWIIDICCIGYCLGGMHILLFHILVNWTCLHSTRYWLYKCTYIFTLGSTCIVFLVSTYLSVCKIILSVIEWSLLLYWIKVQPVCCLALAVHCHCDLSYWTVGFSFYVYLWVKSHYQALTSRLEFSPHWDRRFSLLRSSTLRLKLADQYFLILNGCLFKTNPSCKLTNVHQFEFLL